MPEVDKSDIAQDEWHPSAELARRWLNKEVEKDPTYLSRWLESLTSCNIDNQSRLNDICIGSIKRILNREKISDRYLLGLVWMLRHGCEDV